jgi:chorismate dehydratase
VEQRVEGRWSGHVRIGAVTYLNSRPLVDHLSALAPNATISMDLPSRLADRLVTGRLDVALIPSVEQLRHPDCVICSDACVACDGPVRSIKLYGRVPPERVRSLALDEGSRTSAALAQILFKELLSLEPAIERFPIGTALEDCAADAVMVIGDRGLRCPGGRFEFVWDLGDQWRGYCGLPFVFAMWVARPGVERQDLAPILSAARDHGLRRLPELAAQYGPAAGVSAADCLAYFRDNLRFHLGPRERRGLEAFARLARQHALVPTGARLAFPDHTDA